MIRMSRRPNGVRLLLTLDCGDSSPLSFLGLLTPFLVPPAHTGPSKNNLAERKESGNPLPQSTGDGKSRVETSPHIARVRAGRSTRPRSGETWLRLKWQGERRELS